MEKVGAFQEAGQVWSASQLTFEPRIRMRKPLDYHFSSSLILYHLQHCSAWQCPQIARFSGVKDALMVHRCIYFLARSETIRFRCGLLWVACSCLKFRTRNFTVSLPWSVKNVCQDPAMLYAQRGDFLGQVRNILKLFCFATRHLT